MDDRVNCPECGKVQRDLWDHNWGLSEELTVNCCSCGEEYVLSRVISATYTARRMAGKPARKDACTACGSPEHEDCGQQ
jgi:hypothetical protein